MAQNIAFDMRNRLFGRLLDMSHAFFSKVRQGDVVTRMTSDVDSVQSVVSGTLTSIVNNLVVLVIAVAAMYQKNWILATAGVIMVPLFILPTKRVGEKRWEITREAQKKRDEINQILSETLGVSGQMLVKLFTGETAERGKYERANREMTDLHIREGMAGRWFHAAMNTFTNAGPMVIYLIGGLLMLRFGYAALTVGDIAAMVALLDRMSRPANAPLTVPVDVARSLDVFLPNL